MACRELPSKKKAGRARCSRDFDGTIRAARLPYISLLKDSETSGYNLIRLESLSASQVAAHRPWIRPAVDFSRISRDSSNDTLWSFNGNVFEAIWRRW